MANYVFIWLRLTLPSKLNVIRYNDRVWNSLTNPSLNESLCQSGYCINFWLTEPQDFYFYPCVIARTVLFKVCNIQISIITSHMIKFKFDSQGLQYLCCIYVLLVLWAFLLSETGSVDIINKLINHDLFCVSRIFRILILRDYIFWKINRII